MLYRPLAAALILLSAFTLFWRLDSVPIWRDEATTANWARLMVETGSLMPYVYHDGQLVVQAPDGHDVNSKMLPAMQSYLQFYVSALSFKLLGVSEWSARIPYALLGALTLFGRTCLGLARLGLTGLVLGRLAPRLRFRLRLRILRPFRPDHGLGVLADHNRLHIRLRNGFLSWPSFRLPGLLIDRRLKDRCS